MRFLRACLFAVALATGLPALAQAACPPGNIPSPPLSGGGSMFGRSAAQWQSYLSNLVAIQSGCLDNPTLNNAIITIGSVPGSLSIGGALSVAGLTTLNTAIINTIKAPDPAMHEGQGTALSIFGQLQLFADYAWLQSADPSLDTWTVFSGSVNAADQPTGIVFNGLSGSPYSFLYQPTNTDTLLSIATNVCTLVFNAYNANTNGFRTALNAVLDRFNSPMGNPIQAGCQNQVFAPGIIAFDQPWIGGPIVTTVSNAHTTVTAVGGALGSGPPRMDGGPFYLSTRYYPAGYVLGNGDQGPIFQFQGEIGTGPYFEMGYLRPFYGLAGWMMTLGTGNVGDVLAASDHGLVLTTALATSGGTQGTCWAPNCVYDPGSAATTTWPLPDSPLPGEQHTIINQTGGASSLLTVTATSPIQMANGSGTSFPIVNPGESWKFIWNGVAWNPVSTQSGEMYARNNAEMGVRVAAQFFVIPRRGYASAGDSPTLPFMPVPGACTLNAGAGDGVSQVPLSDGNCAEAIFSAPGVDARDAGADPAGLSSANTALTNGCAAAVAAKLPLVFAAGNYHLTSNLTLNCDVQYAPGSTTSTTIPTTLTINGNVTAPPRTQIFAGQGATVVSSAPDVYVSWWGADAAAVTNADAMPAIRAAQGSNRKIHFTPGVTYTCKSTVTYPLSGFTGQPCLADSSHTNFIYDGYGASLIPDNSHNIGIYMLVFYHGTNFQVRGLTFPGNATGWGGSGGNVCRCSLAFFNVANGEARDLQWTGNWGAQASSAHFAFPVQGDWLSNFRFNGLYMPAIGGGFDLAFLQHVSFDHVWGKGSGDDGTGAINGLTALINVEDDVSLRAAFPAESSFAGYTTTYDVSMGQDVYATNLADGLYISAGSHYQIDGDYSGNYVGGGGIGKEGGGGKGIQLLNSVLQCCASALDPVTDVQISAHLSNNGVISAPGAGVGIDASNIAGNEKISGVLIAGSTFDNNYGFGVSMQNGSANVQSLVLGANVYKGVNQTALDNATRALANPSFLNVADFGVKLDGTKSSGITLTASSAQVGGVTFTPADVGKIVEIPGAGSGGSTLVTTLSSAVSSPPGPFAMQTLASGGSLATGTIFGKVTYTTGLGETLASLEASVPVTGPSGSVVVPSPPALTGATGWNFYASSTTGTETKQNGGTPVAIGTPFTLTALTSGAALPGSNSTMSLGTTSAVATPSSFVTTSPTAPVANNGGGQLPTNFVTVATAGTGNYAPGDTITTAGGTCPIQPIFTVRSVKAVAATLGAGGSGYPLSATFDLEVMNSGGGNGAWALPVWVNVTTNGSGVVTTLNSIKSAGTLPFNPAGNTLPTLTGMATLPLSWGGSGVTVNLTLGVLTAEATTPGNCTTTAGTLTQASSSGTGTGATFTPNWTAVGTYWYGTDETLSWQSVAASLVALHGAKLQLQPAKTSLIYGPANAFSGSATFMGLPLPINCPNTGSATPFVSGDLDFQGLTFRVEHLFAQPPSADFLQGIFLCDDANLSVRNLQFTQALPILFAPGSPYGTIGVATYAQNQNLYFDNLTGRGIETPLGMSNQITNGGSYNFNAGNITTYDSWYGAYATLGVDDATIANLRSFRNYRSLDVYGVKSLRAKVVSQDSNPNGNDVLVSSAGILTYPSTTLNGGINNSVTTMSLTSLTGFPTTGTYFAMIGLGAGAEIVQVTASGSNPLTIVRGQWGTAAATWANNTPVSQATMLPTADIDINYQAIARTDGLAPVSGMTVNAGGGNLPDTNAGTSGHVLSSLKSVIDVDETGSLQDWPAFDVINPDNFAFNSRLRGMTLSGTIQNSAGGNHIADFGVSYYRGNVISTGWTGTTIGLAVNNLHVGGAGVATRQHANLSPYATATPLAFSGTTLGGTAAGFGGLDLDSDNYQKRSIQNSFVNGIYFGTCGTVAFTELLTSIQAPPAPTATPTVALWGPAGWSLGQTTNGVSVEPGMTLSELIVTMDSGPSGTDTITPFVTGAPVGPHVSISGSATSGQDTSLYDTGLVGANNILWLQHTLANAGAARGIGATLKVCRP